MMLFLQARLHLHATLDSTDLAHPLDLRRLVSLLLCCFVFAVAVLIGFAVAGSGNDDRMTVEE